MGTELECGRDAAAYVLGALDESEALAFRLHMAQCAACREEVDLLQSAAAGLPMMVPQQPPPGTLKAAVMNEVRRDARRRQLEAQPLAARRSARSWLGGPVTRPMLAALGALLVLAVITVVVTNKPAGTRVIRAQAAWSHGGAAVKLTGSRGELLVEGMPAPAPGKVYEVWVAHGRHAPAPTDALFDVNDAGEAAVDVPVALTSADTVLVTAEPAGGATVPTPPVLIQARLG
jgi:anti-sigma-K factor RskA